MTFLGSIEMRKSRVRPPPGVAFLLPAWLGYLGLCSFVVLFFARQSRLSWQSQPKLSHDPQDKWSGLHELA